MIKYITNIYFSQQTFFQNFNFSDKIVDICANAYVIKSGQKRNPETYLVIR